MWKIQQELLVVHCWPLAMRSWILKGKLETPTALTEPSARTSAWLSVPCLRSTAQETCRGNAPCDQQLCQRTANVNKTRAGDFNCTSDSPERKQNRPHPVEPCHKEFVSQSNEIDTVGMAIHIYIYLIIYCVKTWVIKND